MSDDRMYDVVVFGATGFTGRLTAEYLAARKATTPLRWALAGRDPGRLAAVRDALAAIDPACAALPVLTASVEDPASLDRMAAQTRVVLTTVGPYARHGEPVVRACVEAGTDYVDITGEPAFVDMVRARYDAAARASRARVVQCCGFDSIPHDLGAYFTVRQLPKDRPMVVEGFVRAKGGFSGGTLHSAVEGFAHLGDALRQSRAALRGPGGGAVGRRARGLGRGLHYERRLRAWACPLPTIDPQIVLRSARALDDYGPDFRYGHYAEVRSTATLAAGALGVGALVALSQLRPTRDLLLKLRGSGEGPSPEERAKGWFRVTFLGRAGDREVMTRVSGGEPGYTETARMVSEAALCLALDRDALPDHTGVLTTAVAMGDALTARLQAIGIRFEVLEGR